MKMDKRELNLSLGIGNVYQKDRYDVKVEVDDYDHHFDQRVERVGFTDEQIKELESQLDVCNYIYWGLPVPNKLLLLVWTSLSPSFTLTSCPLWLDSSDRGTYHQNLTNLMPGRCSRTDGKKWRCCQHVIPNKKYCQKHMWRGKKCSRKLVEAVKTSPPDVNEHLCKNTESLSSFEVPSIGNRKSCPLNEQIEAVIKAPSFTDIVAKRNEKVETINVGNNYMIEKEKIADINLGFGLDYSTKGVHLHHQDDHKYSEAERQVDPPQPVPKRCSRTEGRKRQRINRGLNNPCISPSTPNWAYCKHAKTGMGLGLGIDLNISLSTQLEDPSPNIRYSSTGNSCNTSSVCSSVQTTTNDDSAYFLDLNVVPPRMQSQIFC